MTRQVSFSLPESADEDMIEEINQLVESGVYASQSEAIRELLKDGLTVRETVAEVERTDGYQFPTGRDRRHWIRQAILDLRDREARRAESNG